MASRVNKLTAEEEDKKVVERLKKMEEEGTKAPTIFLKDDTGIYLRDYQIAGFLKAAGIVQRKRFGDELNAGGKKGKKWGAIDSKIRQFIYIEPVRIYLKWDNDAYVKEPTGCLERPLQCETAQGPRVALAKSEILEAPADKVITFKCIIDVLDDSPITKDMIIDMLNYGSRVGLLQWRTAGYGRFTWREIPVANVALPVAKDMWASVKNI